MSHSRSAHLQDHLDLFKIDDTQRARLREAKPNIDKAIPQALDVLYQDIWGTWSRTRDMFGSEESMQSARKKQEEHWKNISSAKFDDEYEKQVTKIGNVHKQIGLDPPTYMAGYTSVITEVVKILVDDSLQHSLVRSSTR